MKYFCFLILVPVFLSAQTPTSSAVSALLNCTQEALGSVDVLVSGTPYVATNQRAKGSPFFKTSDLLSGTVYVKGQPFVGELLRYNLESDKLILHKTLKKGIPYDIELYDNIVDSFTLDAPLSANREQESLFISKKILPNFSDKNGYIEQLFQGKFSFYRTQKIYFSEQFSEKNPYGKFTVPRNSYFVFYENQWTKVNKLKDFLALFPEQSKEIKRFAKKEKIRFKRADAYQFTRLMKFSNEQL